jgi:asparagine synthase (glutamine-hydrolysing)
MGFPVPLDKWFRGPLQSFVRETLLCQRAGSRGLYDRQGIEQALNAEHPYDRSLWGVLCLELWFSEILDRHRAPIDL